LIDGLIFKIKLKRNRRVRIEDMPTHKFMGNLNK